MEESSALYQKGKMDLLDIDNEQMTHVLRYLGIHAKNCPENVDGVMLRSIETSADLKHFGIHDKVHQTSALTVIMAWKKTGVPNTIIQPPLVRKFCAELLCF